jgi:hypothetical protein
VKSEVKEENTFLVYLNKYFIGDIDINKETIQKYLKTVFIHLKDNYNMNIYGYFNINCYINNNYGMILEIKEESIGFPFYSKKTDMKLTFYNDSKFLYNIDNYFIKDILDSNDYTLYAKDNEYYLDINNLDEKTNAYIMENTKRIIYGDEVEEIIGI